MTILFLTRLFYPHIGGVEKHVMEISKRLVADGHEVIIITEELDHDNKKPHPDPLLRGEGTKRGDFLKGQGEKVNGITVYRINVGKNDWFKKFRIWQELWKLRKVIQSADVAHCHDVFFWYLPFRFLYPRKPVYTTFHGYESYPIRKNALVMRKISEKLSWGNICIGDFIAKWYGTKPTIVSYGAVDVSFNTRPHPAPLLKGEGIKKESAVFIGRLDEQTGAVTYANAGEMLRKKYPAFDLTFVGDGNDRKKIEKKFNVLGFQKDPERYLPQYHFAFVSRYLSILEAFVAKRLVFALYDNPIKEDYLKMAPYAKWIVIEKDPEKLTERVSYYLTHPEEEKKLVEQAYQWVKNQSWEQMVNVYLGLWEK